MNRYEVKTDIELFVSALSQIRFRVETEPEHGVDSIVDYSGCIKIYTL